MRFKIVPPTPPADVAASDALGAARDALPLVPRSQDDCCARLVDRVAWIESRDAATEWIAFLDALGIAERRSNGFTRVRDDVETADVAGRFADRILGADAAIGALGEEPRSADAVFEEIVDVVPAWERRRSDTWREEWAARTGRLLAWAALLGIAERRADGYVASRP